MLHWSLIIPLMLLFTQDEPPKFQIQRTTPVSCEGNIILFENVAYIAKKLDKDDVIIVIVRLGKEENPTMNKRRLYTITTYLKDLKLPIEKLITAEGKETNGYGSIEFYIHGKPFLAFVTGKNQEIEVGDCVIDDFSKTKYYMPKTKK